MALGRGERIGDAYVRIYGDGSGIPGDVEDAFTDADPAVNRAGQRHGKDYGDKFSKSFEAKLPDMLKALDKNLKIGRRTFVKNARIAASDYFGEFEKRVAASGVGGDIARRIREDMEDEFSKGNMGLTQISNSLKRLPTLIHKAETELFKERTDNIRALREEYNKVSESAFRAAKGERTQIGGINAHVHALDALVRKLHEAGDGNNDLDLSFFRTRRELAIATPRLTALTNQLSLLGIVSGRAFGKGSRNNFINFFGSLIGAAVGILALIPRLIKGVVEFGQTAKFVFDESLRNTGSTFRASMAVVIASLESAGATVAIFGAGLGALLLLLPVIVSSLVLMGGVVSALAGSISFALVGALGALAGAMLPVVATIGVLVAGIAAMDDAQKKMLKNSLIPVRKEFSALGDVAAKGLLKNLPGQVDDLSASMRGLRPLVKGIAEGTADAISTILDRMNAPGFDRFLVVMEKFLPDAIRSLGVITANTFSGIGGIIIGLVPITERFLDWLTRITDQFDRWAQSASGQSEIERFFQRAGDSAASLGELLDNIGELLGEVFTAGQDTGDTIIDKMAAKIQKMTDYINDHPDAVAKFFGDVGDFADTIGDITVAIFQMIDALDSPNSRRAATAVFGLIEATVQGMILGINIAIDAVHGLASAWNTLLDVVGFVGGVVVTAVASMLTGLTHLAEGLNKLLPKKLEIDTSGIKNAANDARNLAVELASGQITGKLKINVDNKDLKDTVAVAKTTDESLRILLGLPPIRPKADKKPIDGLGASTDDLIGALRVARGVPAIAPKTNNVQLLRTKLEAAKTELAIRQVAGQASKGIKTRIENLGYKLALAEMEALRRKIAAIPRTVTILTKVKGASPGGTGPSASATGSILHPDGYVEKWRKMAAGGFANARTFRNGNEIGEAGREAIVPLDRPLGAVDPAVRALSAYARGLVPEDSAPRVGIDASGWQIITPTENPRAVAVEVINQLVALGY